MTFFPSGHSTGRKQDECLDKLYSIKKKKKTFDILQIFILFWGEENKNKKKALKAWL